MAGGAAAVASMAAALGAEVKLAGFIGVDWASIRLGEMLARHHVNNELLTFAPGRTTPVKTRFLVGESCSQRNLVLRWDEEPYKQVSFNASGQLLSLIDKQLSDGWPQVVLIADYGKSLDSLLVATVIEKANKAGIPALADPCAERPISIYRNSTWFLPNRTECARFAGCEYVSIEDALETAKMLAKKFNLSYVVAKVDSSGLAYFDKKQDKHMFLSPHCRPDDVIDPCGAGDMLLAVIGYGTAVGADNRDAVRLANIAAGCKLRHIGPYPMSWAELVVRIARQSRQDGPESKIVGLDDLDIILRAYRKLGRKITFTNGCFDVLHPGHLATLEYAGRHSNILVVGVNSDRSVRELKGPGRPIIPQEYRLKVIASLEYVDWVVVFDSVSVAPVIERIRPDVLVKGGKEDPKSVVGADFVTSYGGALLLGPAVEGWGTTEVVRRIRKKTVKTRRRSKAD